MIRMPAEGGPEMQITKNGGFGTAVEPAKNDFLYYSKGGLPGIWKVPVSGGTEERASTLGDEGAWAFVGGGLYLFTARPDSREINFFDFTTRKLHRITELPIGSRSTMRNNIFALSPDHRIALYAQVDGTGEHIMLTDGFR